MSKRRIVKEVTTLEKSKGANMRLSFIMESNLGNNRHMKCGRNELEIYKV